MGDNENLNIFFCFKDNRFNLIEKNYLFRKTFILNFLNKPISEKKKQQNE